ncbi:MAG: RNA polymerase sigma factor [Symbiobacterium sp.]|uniref:RNA polymerase sigma factor n=1 Tax=Symbiobacterium sp. TaxID=1971213 RepID=UPI003463DA83
MTDEDLMRQLQQGHPDAVEPLVRRYHKPLTAYFYRLSHDYHLAQDLAQECLFRLVSRAGQYQFPRPVKPWVYQIAVNLWRDHRKSAAYRHGSAALPLDEAAEMPEAGPPPDDDVANRLLAHEALAALQALPPHFAEVLVLRFCQCLTVPEIAAALELPEGTVKSRIYHGLRHLRSRLSREVTCDGQPARC